MDVVRDGGDIQYCMHFCDAEVEVVQQDTVAAVEAAVDAATDVEKVESEKIFEWVAWQQ